MADNVVVVKGVVDFFLNLAGLVEKVALCWLFIVTWTRRCPVSREGYTSVESNKKVMNNIVTVIVSFVFIEKVQVISVKRIKE